MLVSNQAIADFLRQIPQSNQPKKQIGDVYTSESPHDVSVMLGVLRMLSILGIVKLEECDMPSKSLVQASSQTAKYTLMSIADYFERDASIITDWKTRGMKASALSNGATFLSLLENERLRRFADPSPSRYEKIAQVFIKRINPVNGAHELLLQFDKNANHYQLIGGRWSEKDGDDLEVTIVREIEEELPLNDIPYPQAYRLKLLLDNFSVEGTISSTFGALTHYMFWFYHMTDLKRDLKLQPEDKWVPVDMILNGSVIEGDNHYPFANADLFTRIDDTLPDGLKGLSVSC